MALFSSMEEEEKLSTTMSLFGSMEEEKKTVQSVIKNHDVEGVRELVGHHSVRRPVYIDLFSDDTRDIVRRGIDATYLGRDYQERMMKFRQGANREHARVWRERSSFEAKPTYRPYIENGMQYAYMVFLVAQADYVKNQQQGVSAIGMLEPTRRAAYIAGYCWELFYGSSEPTPTYSANTHVQKYMKQFDIYVLEGEFGRGRKGAAAKHPAPAIALRLRPNGQ